jgi:hypothetical protein
MDRPARTTAAVSTDRTRRNFACLGAEPADLQIAIGGRVNCRGLRATALNPRVTGSDRDRPKSQLSVVSLSRAHLDLLKQPGRRLVAGFLFLPASQRPLLGTSLIVSISDRPRITVLVDHRLSGPVDVLLAGHDNGKSLFARFRLV